MDTVESESKRQCLDASRLSDLESFHVGDAVYAQNPKYRDGTRLRSGPVDDRSFNGIWVSNDSKLDLLAISGDWCYVRKQDGEVGWIRSRNLTQIPRQWGVTRDVVTTEIVSPDPEYVRGIKIYNCGIKEDPIPGQKFGKGIQHLISSQWLSAMSELVGSHIQQLQAFVRHAKENSKDNPGYDLVYFGNMANQLFNRAEAAALRSTEAMQHFLMATWLVMAAAEVDDWPFRKYSKEERAKQREEFYAMYLSPRSGPGIGAMSHDDAAVLGIFASPVSRRDLLPPIAMERLGINNELSALKYADPTAPLRDGFLISKRIDSLKRHFEGLHRRLEDEDHVIHLLWNFHAIYHVAVVFPEKNDLVDYVTLQHQHTRGLRPAPAKYEPTSSLEKITSRSLSPAAVFKLDWNEGSIPPPPSVLSALTRLIQSNDGALLKWYPHLGGGEELRKKLAEYCSVIPENILVTNGSDDALVLLCHAFLGPNTSVLVPTPTYEHFVVNALSGGCKVIKLDLIDPFKADVEEIARGLERFRPTAVYLVSPNNPTGIQWSSHQIEGLVVRFPETKFIVDEAYYEFSGSEGPITCALLTAQHRNVVITRTFSKAFCLASLRIGYLIAHPATVEELRAFYNPKSVNQLAQVAALGALHELDTYYRPYIERTSTARNGFLTSLVDHGADCRSGGAGNFVCLRVPPSLTPASLCAQLEKDTIFIRDISSRFPGFVRITIGLDMTRVLDVLLGVLGPHLGRS